MLFFLCACLSLLGVFVASVRGQITVATFYNNPASGASFTVAANQAASDAGSPTTCTQLYISGPTTSTFCLWVSFLGVFPFSASPQGQSAAVYVVWNKRYLLASYAPGNYFQISNGNCSDTWVFGTALSGPHSVTEICTGSAVNRVCPHVSCYVVTVV